MHRSYSILGALFQVIECSDCWLRNAEAAAFKFRSYQSPLCSKFPDLQLEKFPAPIQTLLDKVSEAQKWIAQCEPLYQYSGLERRGNGNPGRLFSNRAGAGKSVQGLPEFFI